MKLQFVPGKPITTTDFQSAQPLGVGGQLVLESWNVLYEILKHGVGLQCAGLLLEPVIDWPRGEVDWYLPSDQPLTTVNTSRDVLLKQAHELILQARELAQQMIASVELSQKQKGELLSQALNYPNEESIIATPYGPAIIAWGHESKVFVKKNTIIAAKGNNIVKETMVILPPPQLFSDKETRFNFWPWFMGLFLLFLLMFLPWWEGLIPMNYCRYYWLGSLVLLLIFLPILCLLIRNHYLSARGVKAIKSS